MRSSSRPRGGLEDAGEILFLEDVAEAPYRIDRMLHQLDFAGVLRRQKAILLEEISVAIGRARPTTASISR